MILRPLFNWLFPPFKPLDTALLNQLANSLSHEAAVILKRRIERVNLVQRLFDETNLYSASLWRVIFDETGRFPLQSSEVLLATVKFKVPESNQVYTTKFWLVNGFLFSFETTPDSRPISKCKVIQTQSVDLHCDPMSASEEQAALNFENWVFVALGSNLGDSKAIVEEAMSWLNGLSPHPLLKSSLIETTPVDCPSESKNFFNAVVGFSPREGETPESLLEALQTIEREFGRRPKKILNEPRTLDLDLIAFGQERRSTPHLTLPHPRAHSRRFVLQPLAEIAPELVLPGQSKSVAQLLAEL